ncbi:hypothetical protein FNH13_01330 [Ornithinimicrobium ciconiae]|uniref:Uncharacterized protein n=1 Tax=Ornithinimicrobium ciconiae TaxID=2594265 RepID=A0A516G6K1_9MICO|nr:hypothetical protein [Ornithinimicrobium ciconiae]QDO87133.1 hypothetical protein FNH13_01330 [Ornithinimicrobium ciconiae]
MTGSRPDPDLNQPDDQDPTGVRSLLAGLPDPGPMPDELMARIVQSLELEQQRRSAGAASSYPGGPATPDTSDDPLGEGRSDHGSVVSLDAERQRRRPGRTVLWLGGAAAVAMVATLSVNQLIDGNGDAGVSAQVPAADSAEAGGDAGIADRDEAPQRDQEDAAEVPPGAVAEPAPTDAGDAAVDGGSPDDPGAQDGSTAQVHGDSEALRVLTADGTIALSTTGWGGQVSSWVAAEPEPGTSSWTSRDALECVTAHGLDITDAQQLLLSDANWDDTPAVLLVTEQAESTTAWVVSPDCDEVLSGPLTLPR